MAEVNLGNDTELNVTLDSQTNLSASVYDINYIPDYVKAEQERRANETIRIANENQRIENEEARQDYYELIQQKVEDGDFDGEDGVSPIVTTSKTDGVTTITIQDVEGTKTATILDGIDGNKVWYGEITARPTLSGTSAKFIATTDSDFVLEKGTLIVVKYTPSSILYNGWGYSLDVNGTGAKTIYWGTSSRPAAAGDPNFYGNGQTWLFVYDGTYYRAVETRFASTSTFGFTKLSDSVSSTSSDLSATPKAVKQAYDKATSVETAAKNDYAHTLTMSYTPSTKSVNVGIANYNGSVLDSGAVELDNLATTDSVDTLNDYVFGEESVSGEGTSLQLTDTLKGKLKSVEYKGNTSQVQYTGKNLYNDNFSDYTRPLDYLIHPITLEQGQAYTLKATLTGTKISGIVVGIVPTGEKYADFSTRMFIAINSGGNTEAKRTITIDETWTSPKLIVYCPASSLQATFESIFENYEIQLEKGNIASPTYEPYVGGIPSPNPSYPQPIQVVSGDNEIVVSGKNLFDKNNANKINGYIDSSGKIISDASNRIIYIPCKPNTIYTISKILSQRFRVATYTTTPQVNSETSKVVENYTATHISITSRANDNYIAVWYYNSNLDTTITEQDILNSIQIEQGNQATTYEAYTGATYPINLGSIELCKIGDYQDYIYKDNGSWYVHKEIGKVVLDGSSALSNYVGSLTNVYVYQYTTTGIANVTSAGGGVCNLLNSIVWAYNNDAESYYLASNTLVFKINKTLIDNQTGSTPLEKGKAYLSTNNFVLYAPLITPTDIPIEDTTLIEQLEALSSVSGITNINQENNDLPMILDVEAFKNNLNGKLGLLDILVKE